MKISITLKCLKALEDRLGANSNLSAFSWQFSSRKLKDQVPLDIGSMEITELDILREVMKAHEEEEVRKVSSLINQLKNPENKQVPSLQVLATMLNQYLRNSGQTWLFSLHAEQRGVAYLPLSVTYHATDRQRVRDEAFVTFELAYNIKGRFATRSIQFGKHDVRRTVPEILRSNNLLVPDKSMLEDHAKVDARFKGFSKLHGEQFWVKGEASVVGNKYWWDSSEVNLAPLGMPTKAVLDTAYRQESRYSHREDARAAYHSDIFDKVVSVPTHPVLPLFSLVHHSTVWINVVNMKKYKYEEGLGDKLILPKTHKRLIGALVHNLDALRDENEADDKSRTLRNKASSSVIVAKGPPGTGKTLTAEVYAEEIKRPLYEVHGSQIGVSAEDIEQNLPVLLERSMRLRMPLLINEADLYIRKRGDDREQNAIVATFLRLLEYHKGLVFLTTNRDDIDDAVISRCIGVITYAAPAAAERLRLWRIMLAEFNATLPEIDLQRAVVAFPTIVGRDIQNLIRLTNRVCKAENVKFSLQELRDNAMFRDIKCLNDVELAAEIERRRKK